jgi:Domain of Unknown Function (DUF1080)
MLQRRSIILFFVASAFFGSVRADDEGLINLFPRDGEPRGWLVRQWDDVSKVAEASGWTVRDGILHSGQRRGTWLMSEKEYGDFILEFEIKLTERGNSGVALRAPLKGDPAFDGMELQIADMRYNPQANASELTGAIYRAIAPRKQVYRPVQWNQFHIELKKMHLKVLLNGELIQDEELTRFDKPAMRHDGSKTSLLKDRPRRGHIGFQHLSRNNEPVLIRHVRLRELN